MTEALHIPHSGRVPQNARSNGVRRSALLLTASVFVPVLLTTLFMLLPGWGIAPSSTVAWTWLGVTIAAGLVAIILLPWPMEWRFSVGFLYAPVMFGGLLFYALGFSCLVLAECI